MPEIKKTASTAAVALAASLAGAGLHAQLSPPLATSARAAVIRIAPDGRLGLVVEGRAGSREGMSVLNWDADGSAPLIEGRPTDDPHARAIGAALAAPTCLPAVIRETTQMADMLSRTGAK